MNKRDYKLKEAVLEAVLPLTLKDKSDIEEAILHFRNFVLDGISMDEQDGADIIIMLDQFTNLVCRKDMGFKKWHDLVKSPTNETELFDLMSNSGLIRQGRNIAHCYAMYAHDSSIWIRATNTSDVDYTADDSETRPG